MKNISALSILQLFNYGLPLITIPYLTRVLGFELLGVLAIAAAINNYFLIIIDYGFGLSATRSISRSIGDVKKISLIFVNVITIKLVLIVFSLIVVIFIVEFIPYLEKYRSVIYWGYLVVAAQSLIPIWYFQGIEEFKYILYISVFGKIITTLMIFTFVVSSDDYTKVPMITGVVSFFIFIFVLVYVYIKHGLKFKAPLISDMKREIIFGFHVFLSRVGVNFYTGNNVIVLGYITNDIVVGYYSLAERIILPIIGLSQPVLQAVYPYFIRVCDQSRVEFFSIFKKVTIALIVTFSMLSIIVFIFGGELVFLLSGDDSKEAALIFQYLAVVIAFGALGPHYSNGLLVLGIDRMMTKVVFVTMLLNLILIYPLVELYSGLGLAVTTIIVYVFHALLFFLVWRKASKLTIHNVHDK